MDTSLLLAALAANGNKGPAASKPEPASGQLNELALLSSLLGQVQSGQAPASSTALSAERPPEQQGLEHSLLGALTQALTSQQPTGVGSSAGNGLPTLPSAALPATGGLGNGISSDLALALLGGGIAPMNGLSLPETVHVGGAPVSPHKANGRQSNPREDSDGGPGTLHNAREKNRMAQRRFRERQKNLIADLKGQLEEVVRINAQLREENVALKAQLEQLQSIIVESQAGSHQAAHPLAHLQSVPPASSGHPALGASHAAFSASAASAHSLQQQLAAALAAPGGLQALAASAGLAGLAAPGAGQAAPSGLPSLGALPALASGVSAAPGGLPGLSGLLQSRTAAEELRHLPLLGAAPGSLKPDMQAVTPGAASASMSPEAVGEAGDQQQHAQQPQAQAAPMQA